METYNINGKDLGTLNCVATLKINGIAEMSEEERAEIVEWLRRLATDFETDWAAYAKKFSAKFYRKG